MSADGPASGRSKRPATAVRSFGTKGPNVTGVLLHCRGGFEDECAKEIAGVAARAELGGYLKARPGSALVALMLETVHDAATVDARIRFADLVFARQLLFIVGERNELPVTDRIAALLPAIAGVGTAFSDVLLESADTNEGKALATFFHGFRSPLRAALERERLIDASAGDKPRLHLVFASSTAVTIAISIPGNSSRWPMGIPRIAFPARAPSRSTLKLAEAFQWWLSADEERALLRDGITAVDLGAAPGGWTWQLVARGVHVTAVDNGALAPAVTATGLVDHVRADGFGFRPRWPVDWMVCDIVEQPHRVALLVAQWLAEGSCTRSIFNLKLPMKKRFDELLRCSEAMRGRWTAAGVRCALRFKHLYHDREEVTGYAIRESDARRHAPDVRFENRRRPMPSPNRRSRS